VSLPQSAAGNGAAASSKGRAAGLKATAEGPKQRSRTKLVLIVVALLLVAFVAKKELFKPHYGPGHPAPPGASMSLDGSTITTNLSDGHLVQIGVALQLTKAASPKKVGTEQARLTSDTIAILGNASYSSLLTAEGKIALSRDLLGKYQQDLGLSEGGQQVSAVYFTSLVLQ
jgi:flagellar FliL protein